jgi:hypothetical protein
VDGDLIITIVAVLVGSAFSAVGAGVLAAFSVGSRIAIKQSEKMAELATKVATLEVRVMNGLSVTLSEIKVDVKELIADANSRPCQKHGDLLELLLDRLKRVEEGGT